MASNALVDPFEQQEPVRPTAQEKPKLVDPFEAQGGGLVDPFAPQTASQPPEKEPQQDDYSYLEAAGRNLKGGYAEMASGLGSALKYGGERLDSDTLRQTGESMTDYWGDVAEDAPPSEAAQVSPFDDPKVLADPRWWTENVSRMAPSFAIPAGVAGGGMKIASKALPGLPRIAGAIGAGAGGLFGGALEGAQTYEEGLAEGQPEETAARAGEAMALGSAVLNALPFYKIMNPSARGVVYNFVTRGMTEGVTEAMEEPLDEIIQGLVYDKEMDWEDVARRAAHVAPAAFLLGGVAGGGQGVTQPEQTGGPDGQPDITATPEESIEDIDATGGDVSTIETADDLAETETGVVEDVALTGEDALAQQVEQEFGDQPVPVQDESIDLSEPVEQAEPLQTADVVAMAPDEEIVMEGPADPDFSDYAERQGLTPPERQRTIQALEQELEPAPVSQDISPSQAPQESDIAVQPEPAQDLDQAAQQAATAPQSETPEPTPAQIEAGNYKKGKVKVNGHDISIENPKGSTRSGTNRQGQKWSTTMKDHYGYLRGTKGKDKDHVDVFLTDQANDTGRPVFVVDQVDPESGTFDEHKVVMGARNEDQARKVYQRNYEKGWQGLGAITQMSQDEFKAWTKGDTTKPVALQETPVERPAQKAETKPAPAEKSAPQTAQTDLIGKYVRSGSTTGKVTAVSEDGKKATLDSGRRVPVGRAKNWTVQDEPLDGAKKRAAKAKQEPQKKAAKEPAKASEKPAESKPKSEKQADTKAARKTGQGMLATAYHGSPHKFDRFDISSIGTGQGAQTFGHGIYIAENKKVADSYRMALSRRNMMTSDSDRLESLEVDGERLVDQYPIEVDSEFLDLIDDQDRILAYRHARERIKRWKELSADESYPFRDYAAEKADAWERLAPRIRAGEIDNPSLGNLYTADIPDSAVSKMLDWDKPLSEQPEVVQDAYRNLGLAEEALSVVPTEGAKWVDIPGMPGGGGYAATVDGRTISNAVHKQPGQAVLAAKQAIARDYPQDGQQMYRWLSQKMGSDEQAARALRDAGIPGIKYLDQGSRTQGEGTRNFVIFDDSLITILERNGEPVTGAERDQVLASMRSEPARGMPPAEAREQLESRFGKKAIRKLEKSGRFTILNSPEQLDTRVKRRLFGENVTAQPSGLYDPKSGKSWLFTDNIGSGDAVGVFLHEVGAHYGLKRMIGAKEYRNVKRRLRDLANDGDMRVREAIFRVPDDTADQYFWDEVLAYLVQHNYKFNDVPSANRAAMKDKLVRALRKVVAQIRAFLNELGFLNTKNLTADDIVTLVQGAAKHAARTAPKSPVQGSQGASQAAMTSKSKRGASTPEQKRERLRRMGLNFENLPGDEQGNPTRPTEPVDQEPETVDTETARENLKKRDFGGPMFSVDQEVQDRGTVAHMVTGEERPTFHPSTRQQNKLKQLFKRFFSKEGLLTDEAFQRHIESMGIKNEDELVAQFMVDGMVKAAQKAYGRPWAKISDRDKAQMNEYLAGNNQAEVPARAKAELDNLRTSLDNLSGRTQQMLIDEITYRLYALSPEQRETAMALIRKRDQELTEADFEGVDPIVARKVMMYRTIEGNKRQYLNRSYAVFDNDKWASEVEPEVVERARQYLRRQVEEDAKLSQMSDNAKADYVEGVINKILNPKGKDMMSFMNSDQLGQKDLSIMKRRKEIAPEIRELMGEYKDPRLNYTRSLAKMSYLVANHHFLRSVREDGLGVFLSAKPSGRMHEEITSWDDNTMAPLAGLYASPEFASALRDAIQPRVLEGWLRSLLMMNAGVKYGKTVLSPTTMARNFYSAAMFTVLNGHFNWSHAVKAGSHTWADLGSSNPAKMDYLKKLVRLGVLHDNPRARELQEAMDEAANMNDLEGSLPARGLKTALNAATKMYRAGDDFWKIIGFENEKANLMKHGMTEVEAEAMAADRIRNGYPTYSMVPKAIQLLRRFPLVGTFVAFPWEIMRTTRHQFRMMSEDRKAGRKDMFAKRAVGMAIAGGLAHGISKATMAWMGLDDEDDEAVRQMAPEWQENAQLAYLGYGDNGHLRYLDLSHLDPYTYLKVPFIAMANGNYDTVDRSAAAATREFLEPFLGTEIGFGAFMDVWTNSTEHGPVYDEHADLWIQGKQAIGHLITELQPGVLSNMERTLMAWHGEYASYGRKYDLGDEALAWIGFRTTTMDPEISLRFRSFEFNDQKSDASQPTYRAFRDPNIGAYKDIPDAVKRSRAQWRAAFKDMHASIRASRSIGMEDRDIKDALLWGGVAKKHIPYLLKGRTPPWRPYKPTLENARESIIRTRDDPQEKRALMQDFKKRRETLYQQLSQ